MSPKQSSTGSKTSRRKSHAVLKQRSRKAQPSSRAAIRGMPTSYVSKALFSRTPDKTHREIDEFLLGRVVVPANNADAYIGEFDVNPLQMGMRISNEARLYQKWIASALEFEYVPAVGTTTPGQLMFCYNPDITDPYPAGTMDSQLMAFSSYQASVKFSVSTPCKWRVPLLKQPMLNVTLPPSGTSSDWLFSYQGVVYIVDAGCPKVASETVYGTITVRAVVEFQGRSYQTITTPSGESTEVVSAMALNGTAARAVGFLDSIRDSMSGPVGDRIKSLASGAVAKLASLGVQAAMGYITTGSIPGAALSLTSALRIDEVDAKVPSLTDYNSTTGFGCLSLFKSPGTSGTSADHWSVYSTSFVACPKLAFKAAGTWDPSISIPMMTDPMSASISGAGMSKAIAFTVDIDSCNGLASNADFVGMANPDFLVPVCGAFSSAAKTVYIDSLTLDESGHAGGGMPIATMVPPTVTRPSFLCSIKEEDEPVLVYPKLGAAPRKLLGK